MNYLKSAILIVLCQLLLFSAGAQQFPAINITTNTNPSNGYTFLASYGSATSGVYYLLILDKQGRIVYAKSFPSNMNGSLLDFKPQPNNKYSFFNSKQDQYYILDKNFNIINTIKAKNGYSTNNHELIMSDENQYYIIADESRTIDMSQIVQGGKTNAQVIGNIIQGIDSNNNLIFEWKVLDYISLTDHVGDLTAPNIDFAHTNSLFLDTDSTILMCNPQLNEITKINLNDSSIIWRFGLKSKSNQFTITNDTLGFIFQHYVNRLSNGNLTLFDNGLGRYARAVEYEIDEVNKTANLVFQYRRNPDISGPSMGSVNRISNGNTFICWGSANRMTEVDTAGNKVFEASFPSGTYRAMKYDIPNPVSHLFSGPNEVCEGHTAVYKVVSGYNCTYSWTVTNGVIVSGQGTNIVSVKWSAAGQGTLKLVKNNSINHKDYFLVYVTVLSGPKAKMSVVQMCNEVKFADSSASSVSCFWDFGDGNTSMIPQIKHNYNSTGTFPVKLKVINSIGCTDSIIKIIVIPDSLKADFKIDSFVCVNQQIKLSNTSTNAKSYLWNFGNSMTSNLNNPTSFYYSTAGNYNVKLIISSLGCYDSVVKSITVNSNPKALISWSKICNGARFMDSSENSLNRIWDFGDGKESDLAAVDHLFNSPGNYQVKLKVFNNLGCTDSNIQTLTIPNPPKADISIDTAVCVNETIKIINKSTNAESYFWNFGNSITSDSKEPLHIFYSAAGSYHVKMYITGSACIDSITKQLTVNPLPEAQFSLSRICHGTRFTDYSVNTVKRIWDFGDGKESDLIEVDHIYSLPGIYQVKLKVFNQFACADSSTQTAIIPKSPRADFITDTVICANKDIKLNNKSTDSDNYFWDFGDSRTSFLKTPEAFSYSTTGTYQIKLVVSDSSCSDSLIKTISVMPNPEAKFGTTQLSDSAIQFTDSSLLTSGSIVSWYWNFGDGKTSVERHPVHVYPKTGTYSVSLCVFTENNCEDCDLKAILIKESDIDITENKNSISVFPNPNNGFFTLKSSKIPEFIVITNPFGQEFMFINPKSDIERIDMSNTPKGVYFVKLKFENSDQMIRVIKF